MVACQAQSNEQEHPIFLLNILQCNQGFKISSLGLDSKHIKCKKD